MGLKEEPVNFIHIFNPMTKSFKEDEEGSRMLWMWINDIKLQDDAKPRGYHSFHCPLYVFKALRNWMFDSTEAQETMDAGSLEWHRQRAAIQGSAPHSAALWDHPAYSDWRSWT